MFTIMTMIMTFLTVTDDDFDSDESTVSASA